MARLVTRAAARIARAVAASIAGIGAASTEVEIEADADADAATQTARSNSLLQPLQFGVQMFHLSLHFYVAGYSYLLPRTRAASFAAYPCRKSVVRPSGLVANVCSVAALRGWIPRRPQMRSPQLA